MGGLLITNPAYLSALMSQQDRIKAGDTIMLRAGTYTFDQWIVTFDGTEELPITIQPYINPTTGIPETVILDGGLDVQGEWTVWKNLIGTYSGWTTREIALDDEEDQPSNKLWMVSADNTKLINNVLHDLIGGIYSYGFVNCLFYGNIIYNIGWSDLATRGHGHCFYTHNNGAINTIKDNICHDPFATCIKVWGVSGACKDYDVIGNTAFQGGVPYGRTASGAHVNWNLLFGSQNTIGSNFLAQYNMTYHTYNEGVFGTSNLAHGVGITSPEFLDNYLAGRYTEQVDTLAGTPVIEDNTFIGGSDLTAYENNTFVNWGSASDTYFVRPNDYDTTRANLTIYNWSGANTVEVDLTSVTGLAASDQVTVANVQDLFVDIQTLTLDANKKVIVNMQAVNRTVAAPSQWTAPISTFPTFGCFLVKKI